METRRNLNIAVIGGLFALLYISLFLVIRRAAKILERQHGQIVEATVELEDKNGQLFQRTQELVAAQETLVQRERLATLGELTATVSHELRNPLAAIRTSVHLAIKKTEGLEIGVDRSLERAERNIVRCDNIISSLLGFASEPECAPDQIDGDEWLKATLSELDVPGNVEVVRRFGGPDAQIIVSPERIRQAIINVFENALQAVAELPKDKTRIVTVRTRVHANLYKVAIQDNGPGISPETLARALDPLFSTKSYGCGLGLPTVKKIVEKYGGAVRIKSEIGTGTEVEISLPLKHALERVA